MKTIMSKKLKDQVQEIINDIQSIDQSDKSKMLIWLNPIEQKLKRILSTVSEDEVYLNNVILEINKCSDNLNAQASKIESNIHNEQRGVGFSSQSMTGS
jgi:hypothetical protein